MSGLSFVCFVAFLFVIAVIMCVVYVLTACVML